MTPQAEQLISDLMTELQIQPGASQDQGRGVSIHLTVPAAEKTFLNEDEAAAFCNIGKTSFRHAVTLNLLPYCIFPGSTKKLFHRGDLEKAVKSNRKKGLQSDRMLP